MKSLHVSKSDLKGVIAIPTSKSHTMRALLFGAMGKGKTRIHRYLPSPDTDAMIQALRHFGIAIEITPDTIEIQGGKLRPAADVIDSGNSGQVLRFIAALAGLLPTYTIVTGDHSIRENRPVQPLLSAMEQLGAMAVSSRLNGKAPIIIRGPMRPGTASLLGEDSQPVSGLLIAASFLDGVTHLHVTDPGEKPWIDLTLSWIKRFGGKVSHRDYASYTIEGPLSYSGFETTIPGDFSSAAFPLIAALITNSQVTLENIDMGDVQGDKKIVDLLMQMGARFDIDHSKKTLAISKHSGLKGMRIDANDIIDAIPILAVLGCFAVGKTEIVNAAIARKKESDRIHAIATELKKMGAQIEELEHGMIITPAPLHGATVASHSDHRIAMALSIAALAASGETTIQDIACMGKSYPSFVSDFQNLQAKMRIS